MKIIYFRKKIFYVTVLFLFLIIALAFQLIGKDFNSKQPNILFIAVDDLRPELGIFGNQVVKSPNIDQLAREGSYFTKHYVQVPTCGASRYSLMTGLRPQKKIHLENNVFYKEMARKKKGDLPESFVHHLRKNGYTTVGIGKLSHSVDGLVYGFEEKPSDVKEMPHSWDRFIFNNGKWKTGWNAFFAYANGENRHSLKKQVKPYENVDVPDNGYPDGLILNSALEQLKDLNSNKQPFFLGVGFLKPHLPFNAPKKYWDLYDRSSIPVASDPFIPENVHQNSIGRMGEFYNYELSDEKPTLEKPLSDEYSRKLIHGYFASISYIDNLIGKLMIELKSLDLHKNTMIVLWGDHGWHLGNDRKWGKHTLFERSLKSALIIKLPGDRHSKREINTVVESVDLYPTIMEYCEIEPSYKLDGESLLSLIKSDNEFKKNYAYSFWKNGLTVRTDRYRLTKFFRKEEPIIELYDHYKDPDENINIASNNKKIIESLMPLLNENAPKFYSKTIRN